MTGFVARLMAVTRVGMSAWPLTRRNERSASSMPAAIHRFFIVPSRQFFTRPVVVRQIEIIDSMQFVFVNVRRNRTGIASRATVNISSSPSRNDAAASGWSRSSCPARSRHARNPLTGSGCANAIANRRSIASRSSTPR